MKEQIRNVAQKIPSWMAELDVDLKSELEAFTLVVLQEENKELAEHLTAVLNQISPQSSLKNHPVVVAARQYLFEKRNDRQSS